MSSPEIVFKLFYITSIQNTMLSSSIFLRDCESILNAIDEVLIFEDRFALAESQV